MAHVVDIGTATSRVCGHFFLYIRNRKLRTVCDNCPYPGCEAARPLARARYLKSPKGRARDKRQRDKRYGTLWYYEHRRKYLSGERGRASVALQAKRRYKRLFYGAYLTFRLKAFRDRLPCGRCGKLWMDGPRGVTHEIDHTVALMNGGTHRRENLQVLCYYCHRDKTALDRGGG